MTVRTLRRIALRETPEFVGLWPLLAVAVLTLNDAFWKSRFHNTVTGKLSDFAGCFFLPLYISALLGLFTRLTPNLRVRIGAALTTLLFVSTSMSRVAADWVCAVLLPFAKMLGINRLRIAADPTDLIALPMVLLAVGYALHRSTPES